MSKATKATKATKAGLVYTVLMSVYVKENPAYLAKSVKSVLLQTVQAGEILILKDGPLTPELDDTLSRLETANKGIIKVVSFEKNRGLGQVLADGVVIAKNDLIGRMDSDDIAHPSRFERQLECFRTNPGYDIVGCNVTEFIDSPVNIVVERIMPENQDDVIAFSHKRNPFAHPSVMFRKASVIKSGNYRDFKLCEDYDLWVRMIQDGARCHNIQEYLVNMRLSPDFYARRGGLTYVRRIVRFKHELLNSGYYSRKDFLVSATSTSIVGLMPNRVRSLLYSRFLRLRKTVLVEG